MSALPWVYVCDDSLTIRSHLTALLGPIAQVKAFERGEALLEAALVACPDLVVSDVNMEGIDGYEVCRRVRAAASLSEVPVILLTSEAADESRAVGLETGADDYLIKPVRPRELLARTRSLIALRRSRLELLRSNEALKREVSERERVEQELRLAQKLEALGRIAGGVAHEINTPVQFVSDSCSFLKDALNDTVGLVGEYQELLEQVAAGKVTAADARARRADAEERADWEFVQVEAPKAVDLALEGCHRVANIVRAMRDFAHPDQGAKTATDLNRVIKNTTIIANNEFKHVAELQLALEPLPAVACRAGEISQVLLNLIVNAAHAIGDVVGKSGGKGKITISSRPEGGSVRLTVADTGAGIPPEIRAKVFDPFFTTKPVGKGTGQGLALAHAVVVKGHGGTIAFESEVGRGTTFTVQLPLAEAGEKQAA